MWSSVLHWRWWIRRWLMTDNGSEHLKSVLLRTDSDDEVPMAEPQPAEIPVAEEIERREPKGKGPDRRKSRIDRRTGMERRQTAAADAGYTGPERRTGKERRLVASLERRRGPGRRRSDERRSAEEGEMDAHQFEFVMAIETYKKVNRRMYPTWTEILEIVAQLGYRKVRNRNITLDNVPEPALYDGVEREPAECEECDEMCEDCDCDGDE